MINECLTIFQNEVSSPDRANVVVLTSYLTRVKNTYISSATSAMFSIKIAYKSSIINTTIMRCVIKYFLTKINI